MRKKLGEIKTCLFLYLLGTYCRLDSVLRSSKIEVNRAQGDYSGMG